MKRNSLFVLLTYFLLLFSFPLFAGTWQEITRSGVLRVLTIDGDREYSYGLHRMMMPIDREQALLKNFAKENGLELQYVRASGFSDLFEKLRKGKGDLISANLSKTPGRDAEFLLSQPFEYTREMVFTARDSNLRGKSPEILKGYEGWILPGTSYMASFRPVIAKNPGMKINVLPVSISHDELIERVASGVYAYSVLNECDLDVWSSYRNDIRKLFPVRSNVPLVFVAGKDSAELIARLNKVIRSASEEPGKTASGMESGQKLSLLKDHLSVKDLDAIRKRGYIRMLTSNDLFGCYLKGGRLCGFEYDLAKRFADGLGVRLITVIPPDFKDLTVFLAEGKGDFIAANFTRTADRVRKFGNLGFCSPYGEVTQVLIGRINETISAPEQLAGRKIHVRKGNSYYDTLINLQKRGIKLAIIPVKEDERPIHTLQKVEKGIYDLTVMDNTFLKLGISSGCKVKGLFELSEKQAFSWVVRKNNPKLKAAINAFFKKENRSTFFNLCKKHYYSTGHVKRLMPLVKKGQFYSISPYDDLFKKYGVKYDFQWYFLAAQSYQESRFDTKRVNHLGASGLMQVMPETAKEMKIRNLTVPENGIHAGTKYMSSLRKRISGKLSDRDKLCFTLAAYNAGYGHVLDARNLASRLGLNPNIWFGNTEKALSLLEDKRYFSRAKFGYCRASETIPYVNNIMLQTYHYQKMLEALDKKTGKK